MYNEKLEIIKEEGTPVQIVRSSVIDTTAIIGMVVKSSFDMFAIENQRKGLFLPDTQLTDGEIVHTDITNEDFMSISVFPEIYEGSIMSYVAMLLKCNVVMNVYTYKRIADDNGNIKTVLADPVVISGYRLMEAEKLKQFDSGLMPEAKSVVYTPFASSITIGSQISIGKTKYKVIGLDNGSFRNTLVIQLGTDVR